MTTEPRILHKDAFTVVGMKTRTTAMSPEIPQLWASFVPRIGEVPLIAELHVSYGLMVNFDPAEGAVRLHGGSCGDGLCAASRRHGCSRSP